MPEYTFYIDNDPLYYKCTYLAYRTGISWTKHLWVGVSVCRLYPSGDSPRSIGWLLLWSVNITSVLTFI